MAIEVPDLFAVTHEDMINEVRREIAVREAVYAKWSEGASILKKNKLARQQLIMRTVLKYLEGGRET